MNQEANENWMCISNATVMFVDIHLSIFIRTVVCLWSILLDLELIWWNVNKSYVGFLALKLHFEF